MDLLRWWRFLKAAGVGWERASLIEARDFCRWLQVSGMPVRPCLRERGALPALVVAGGGVGGAYSPSVRAHSETVLRAFYEFHRDVGTGPVINHAAVRARRTKKYVLVAVTELYSLFFLGRRTRQSFRDFGILPAFAGVVVSDRYANYFHRGWEHIAGNQACGFAGEFWPHLRTSFGPS
jgi:hypothetical protein